MQTHLTEPDEEMIDLRVELERQPRLKVQSTVAQGQLSSMYRGQTMARGTRVGRPGKKRTVFPPAFWWGAYAIRACW